MAVTRIASTDTGYVTGQLSLFPSAKDSQSQLYLASNNCQTVLSQSLTYSAQYLVVEDTSCFPSSGILHVGPPPGQKGPSEQIYYETKTAGTFGNLIRGFAGSRQNPWPLGSVVSCAVSAQHHNTIKDAIIQIETDLGTKDSPTAESLNGILKSQESRFLSPRVLFRAYPTKGAPSLKVRFQNFSVGPLVKFLWDFGDGTTSIEKSPVHTYQNEGIYTVKLSVISALGAQGVAIKSNYIEVNALDKQAFFYVTPTEGISKKTADETLTTPTTFNFIDQTDGTIVQRYWIFNGPGEHNGFPVPTESLTELDPNIHTSSYTYNLPGVYEPSLLILFENQQLKRVFLTNKITVY